MANELILNTNIQNEVNENLYDIERSVLKADCIIYELFEHEFDKDKITIEDFNDKNSPNHLSALMLLCKYEDIKTKLDIVRDYLYQIKNTIKPLSDTLVH